MTEVLTAARLLLFVESGVRCSVITSSDFMQMQFECVAAVAIALAQMHMQALLTFFFASFQLITLR